MFAPCLQVAYLDNVLLGSATMIHYEFPRSAAYNFDNMTAMICKDTMNSSVQKSGRVFGISKVFCYFVPQ
jgi:hypothetical protein